MSKVVGVLLFWFSLVGAVVSYFPNLISTPEIALKQHIRQSFICDDTDNIDCYLDKEARARVVELYETGEGTAKGVVRYQIPLINTNDYNNTESDDLKGRDLVYTDIQVSFQLEKTFLGWVVLNDVFKTDNLAYSKAFTKSQVPSYQLAAGMDLLSHRVCVILLQNFDSSVFFVLGGMILIWLFYAWLGIKGKRVSSELFWIGIFISVLSFGPMFIDRILFQ